MPGQLKALRFTPLAGKIATAAAGASILTF
jgi:hypothetical protein